VTPADDGVELDVFSALGNSTMRAGENGRRNWPGGAFISKPIVNRYQTSIT
jgi:hypothetical protein